jgi:hypothetical protein
MIYQPEVIVPYFKHSSFVDIKVKTKKKLYAAKLFGSSEIKPRTF